MYLDNDSIWNGMVLSSSGNYSYLLTDSVNCDTSFNIYFILLPAIEEVNIYPNPSNNVCNVEFISLISQDLKIVLRNIIGQRIENVQEIKQIKGYYNMSLDLNKYNKGIYLLSIEANYGITINKLIIN